MGFEVLGDQEVREDTDRKSLVVGRFEELDEGIEFCEDEERKEEEI